MKRISTRKSLQQERNRARKHASHRVVAGSGPRQGSYHVAPHKSRDSVRHTLAPIDVTEAHDA